MKSDNELIQQIITLQKFMNDLADALKWTPEDEAREPESMPAEYHPLLDPQDPFLEDNQNPDLGGTGHGDISHSDADEGL